MTTFKQFLESTETSTLDTERDNLKHIVDQISIQNHLPQPTTYLDSGAQATVFNTTDDKVVARISDSELNCDKLMQQKKFQNSKGVVKILGIFHSPDNKHTITYKEKVITNWQSHILQNFPKFMAHDIINTILSIPYEGYMSEEIYQKLKEIPETKNFAKAIKLGIPLDDLSEDNIAITNDGRIVVIDC